MKSITKYIFEKNNNLLTNYCIVQPLNKMYDIFIDKYKNHLLENPIPGKCSLFLLNKSIIKKYKHNENVLFYNIPNEYYNIDDLNYALLNSEIDINNLQKISKQEIK